MDARLTSTQDHHRREASRPQSPANAMTAQDSPADPVNLLFEGMEKLGPGSNEDTLQVLRMLPSRHFRLIVDGGCGAGRQTIALVKELGEPVHALDTHAPFLQELTNRAQEAGVGHLVLTRCMDMKDVPAAFHDIDLLWSEGAAYNIGFANALAIWAPAIKRGAFAVVSELSWLRARRPDRVSAYFAVAYPAMHSLGENIAVAEAAGYSLHGTHTIPPSAWQEDYYDILEPRARVLASHADPAVRSFAAETLEEIDVFKCSGNSYGYVFYVLQRT